MSLPQWMVRPNLLVMVGLCIAINSTGCKPPDPGLPETRPERERSGGGGSEGQMGTLNPKMFGRPKIQQEPELEEGAVNEDGEVMLQEPDTEPDAEPTESADSTSGSEPTLAPEKASELDAPTPAEPEVAPEEAAADGDPAPQVEDDQAAVQKPVKATSVAAIVDPDSGSDNERQSSAPVRPVEANVATFDELNQSVAQDWPKPQAVLFVSGQQHGYIEPCGCTGLDKQKGGLIRRDTLLTSLKDRGWSLIPVDVGNQVRRVGKQAEIKFAATVDAFKTMGYEAAAFGVDDLQLSSVELVSTAGTDERNPSPFLSANVVVLDESFFDRYRIVEAGGRKIGITGILGAEFEQKLQSDDLIFTDPVESLQPIVEELRAAGCDFMVLLAHASLEESAALAQAVPGFDVVVTAGGFGEPTLHPERIEGSESVMVQVGTKGMYGGIIGLFDDEQQPIRYQKIAISSQFKDSERMLTKFASYQSQLKDLGFDGLGLSPFAHPTGRNFVGSETCGDCHTTAYEIWEQSPHVHATESIIAANNDRGGIPRHFDPECVSCHATGWDAQRYYPYATGFESPEKTEHLMGSGCENCHGPGKDHVDAEYGDVEVTNEALLQLRKQMVLRYEDARDRCLKCHDLDNSPDFKFEDYWEKVKHYGKD